MSFMRARHLSSGPIQGLYVLHMQRLLWAANGSSWPALKHQRHLYAAMTKKQAGSFTNKRAL